MKKTLTLLLISLCTLSLATFTNGTSTEYEQFHIPKAITPPVIDGIMAEGEWDNALQRPLTAENTEFIVGHTDILPTANCYWLWDEAGLYFFGDVSDETASEILHAAGNGSYNSGDGLQFCIYPDTAVIGEAPGNMYFYSLVVNEDGGASVGEHFTFGTVHSGADVPDVSAACTTDGANYTIEAFFPASCQAKTATPITMTAGTTFAMTHVIMDADGTRQSLIIDSAWFYAPAANKYTLVDSDFIAVTEETDGESVTMETAVPITESRETEKAEEITENEENRASASTGVIVAVAAGVVAAAAVVLKTRKR